MRPDPFKMLVGNTFLPVNDIAPVSSAQRSVEVKIMLHAINFQNGTL